MARARAHGDGKSSARAVLLAYLDEPVQLRGESGFSYGRLNAIEQYNATDSDARYRRAWSSFPRP